jgi:ankyrin repeat protein
MQEVFRLLMSLEDQEKTKSHAAINDWLDVSKFNDHYSVTQHYEKQVASRLKGTCDWIFSHDAYSTWVSEEPHCNTAKILWIHAPAGHGKSVLCARVVEHLKSEQSNCVAYFFASPHAQSGGMPDFVVRSWIAQIAQLDPDVLQLVKQNYKPGQRASDPVVWELFESIVSDSHNYVFVLDGFDEYTRLNNVRSQFLQKLKRATDRTTARVIITSRNETDIETELSPESADDLRIVILRCKITREDVDDDISLFSKSLVDAKLPRKDESLRQELAGQLAQKCEGMFLWMKMQQDQLRGGKNAKQLQKIVNNMPAGLMKTYERNWNTILNHCHEDRANALAILKWATFAFRPMSVLEITEALIVDHNEGEIVLRRDDLPDEINEDYINGEIIDICGGLVEVRNEETVDYTSAKTLHLIHASVRDFLLSGLLQNPIDLNRTETIPVLPVDHSDQHIELAIVCLGYLSNYDTWDQHTECESPNHRHDFTCYALRYWNKHVNSGGQNNADLLPLLKSFFRRGNPGFEHWSGYINSVEPTVDEDEEDESKDVPATPLYYAALLGLSALMEQILLEDKYQLNQVGGIYGTPLQAACFKGNESAFQILLSWGADPNTRGGRCGVPINAALTGGHGDMVERLMRLDLDYSLSDPRGRTVLYTASKHGNCQAVRTLLEAGADHTTANKYGWTPINTAAECGHLEIVKLLLDKGADFTVVNDNGESPLHSAADRGRYEVVKLLLDRGANASKQDSSGWTPLNSAAHNDHLEIVKSLIEETDENIDVPNNDGWTPLNSAANNGNAEIVKFLLARGASIDCTDKNNNTPIQLAAFDGHLDVVKLLLDNNADITIVDNTRFTPLSSAAYSGHLEIVRLLLEKGAEIESASGEHNTPLQLATLNGHLEVVKLLLEHNADVVTVNKHESTPLSTAASQGYLEIAECLLKKGADLSAVNSSGLTPLHLAAWDGHPNVVEFLLQQGADFTTVDENNGTPVASAARFGHLEVVKLLLQHGADTTLKDNNQSTPFTLAARFGHLGVVKLLLEKGVDLNTPDTAVGWTPLASSASNGHLEVVKLLLDQGAETVANSNGWTPLNSAASNGHVEVVKLLLERGADMTPEESGWTPLNLAASNGHVEVVKLLLERGADMTPNKDGWTPLNSAASNGHAEVVKLLLERGADMTPEEIGWTPLNSAASNNHVEVVRLLLEGGADMAPDNRSWTPLNVAANNGHLEIVRLLLEGGADIAPLKSGWTTLDLAASNGHVEVVRLLLERGADMTPEESGRTPLYTACYYGRTGVVKLFLEQNADMTASNFSWTPLSVAADRGHLEIVKMLLKKGADTTAATKTGWTPLSAAADSGHLEVVETLFDVTADINRPVPRHGTLWHAFAKQGYSDLLKSGYETRQADLCRINPHGLTCLHLAARKGHLETFQYLLSLDLQCPEEDAKGDGLLAHAVCGGSEDIIKLLLERDSKTPFESKHWMPLHWACRQASAEVVEMLLQAGYRSKPVTLSQPEGQWSPLSVAIFHNNQSMLDQLSESSKALLSVGAEDVQIQSERHGGYSCDACVNVCRLRSSLKHC